jgi:hypothetical protein
MSSGTFRFPVVPLFGPSVKNLRVKLKRKQRGKKLNDFPIWCSCTKQRGRFISMVPFWVALYPVCYINCESNTLLQADRFFDSREFKQDPGRSLYALLSITAISQSVSSHPYHHQQQQLSAMGFIPTETNVASSYNIRYYVYCM